MRAERTGARVLVVGGSLPGLAAAARLAKLGHDVTIVDAADRLGARWADPDAWPATLHLPAAWRDLFTKSGRPLDPTLTVAGLALEPAPAAWHVLGEGFPVALPADRATQGALVRRRFDGDPAWGALLDRLSADWQVLRRHGLEADEPVDRATLRELGRPAADGPSLVLADPLAWPRDRADVPEHALAGAFVERTFGRWRVTRDGDPVGNHHLLDLLIERVGKRCDVVLDTPVDDPRRLPAGLAADLVVDATSPWSTVRKARAARLPRGVRPALAPATRREPSPAPSEPAETFDHPARSVAHQRREPDGSWVRVVADFTRTAPDPGLGADLGGHPRRALRRWGRLPSPVVVDGVVTAHAAMRAGGTPWGQILTGALAAYAAHEHLTGESARPVDDPRKKDRR